MNTYLTATTAAYCYEPYDYIYLIYANTLNHNIKGRKFYE